MADREGLQERDRQTQAAPVRLRPRTGRRRRRLPLAAKIALVAKVIKFAVFVARRILQNLPDPSISRASSLQPGRICMITSYSRIASPRPGPVPDAFMAF